jgi:riboflavin synthase
MFTGLIEEIGIIREARTLGSGRALRVEAATVLGDLSPGDSVAVDGVCLTATAVREDGFEVEVVATTLERTALGDYAEGRRVNLERAVALGDRLGGHLVQGHVDGVGAIRSVTPRGELVLIEFELPDEVAPVTVLHGSIALNGVSLTVNDLPAPGVCGVSIIPFTWSHTALADLRPGDRANVEGDLIGKYVRRLLGRPGNPAATGAADLLRGWGY